MKGRRVPRHRAVRFDGDMLRNVALVDNWDHSIEHGDDVPVASVIPGANGDPWGALCHFDTARCDSKNSDMPLIMAAAKILYTLSLAG